MGVQRAGGARQGRRADGERASTGWRDQPATFSTVAAIAGRGAGFRSLGDTWADTTTAHGRLMLAVLGGLAEFESELIHAP
jgi:DNA invertase Pin-like site-specific DNA recombinase